MNLRLASGVLATVLAFGGVAACGSNNTDCNLNTCTVTFDGVNAEASVLGVSAKVVAINGDQVTIEVAGSRQTITVGQPAVSVGPFQAQVTSADKDKIIVVLSR